MSVFNNAWNGMGTEAAAESTRRTILHLLYGPEETPLEDRLNQLLEGEKSFAMTGFKEALLTKVLCIMRPDRFLSILIYTSRRGGGKREIARAVYGLELPAPERVNWTRGRMVLWSNDLLRDLVGEVSRISSTRPTSCGGPRISREAVSDVVAVAPCAQSRRRSHDLELATLAQAG